MTGRKIITAVFAAFLVALALQSRAGGTVQVVFDNPAVFADLKDSPAATEPAPRYLGEIRKYLEEAAGRRLAGGERLAITIKEIDMAGNFEPWRGPQLQNVRIVRNVYPPRIDLQFKLTGAKGNVLKERARKLRNFQAEAQADPGDPLRYEKALLDDWLRTEFP